MSWTVVNPDSPQVTPSTTRKCVSTQAGNDLKVHTASKYRVNVIAAAEILVKSECKRKRTIQNAPRGTLPKAPKRSSRVPAIVPAHEGVVLDKENLPPCLEHEIMTKVPKSTIREEAHSVNIESKTMLVQSGTSSAEYPGSEAFPDRDDLRFDDFDDSVFDEPTVLESNHSLLLHVSTASLSCGASSQQPAAVTQHVTTPAKSPIAPLEYPNGAPFPPFMHPCLLDSLRTDALASAQYDTSTPPPKHTCFRTAEILRLNSFFRNITSPQCRELIVALFATITEVTYANAQGSIQGLVLGDIFFDKPHITTSSRIPYSGKGLISSSQANGRPKALVKATIRIHRQGQFVASHTQSSTLANVSPAKRPPITPCDITPFEIITLRGSSWMEVKQTRMIIEQDYRARCESQTTGGTNRCIDAEHKQRRRGCDDIDTLARAKTIENDLSEEELAEDVDISDFEVELPDILDLLKDI